MAILKKGILGVPKGKIANIMGYRRNGVSVISSLPTVFDAKKRTFNLTKKALLLRLIMNWQGLSLPLRFWWSLYNKTSQNDFEFYYHLTSSIVLDNFSLNLTNNWFVAPYLIDSVNYNISYNTITHQLIILFSDNTKNSRGQQPSEILVQRWSPTYTSVLVGSIPFIIGTNSYIFDLTNHQGLSTLFFTVRIKYVTPTTYSQWLIADPLSVRT